MGCILFELITGDSLFVHHWMTVTKAVQGCFAQLGQHEHAGCFANLPFWIPSEMAVPADSERNFITRLEPSVMGGLFQSYIYGMLCFKWVVRPTAEECRTRWLRLVDVNALLFE